MSDCPERSELVETEISRVATQYREAQKFLDLMRSYLGQVADVIGAACAIPSFFDIDTSVGDQLTKLGQLLGWPRCHCVCTTQPVYGFPCDDSSPLFPVVDFCDPNGDWADCGPFGFSELCLNDDETYRLFLKVRRYQVLSLYDRDSLREAIQIFWGPTAAIMHAGNGRVVISFGRALTAAETGLLQLYPRVLPIAPGIRSRFHFGPPVVFGFGEGWGGFCEPWAPDGLALATEDGTLIVTEDDEEIFTGPLTKDAEWMCETDLRPYDCAL